MILISLALKSPIIFNSLLGKRKALAKEAETSSATASTIIKSEALMECWDIEQQSVSVIPAPRIKQLYNARDALLPDKSKGEKSNLIFPLSSDHLITLLQFNVLRALAVNHTLITGILTTPLDCDEEVTHITPYPANPERVPATLLPTALQQTVPHGSWIDTWPCPIDRDRLIRATGTYDPDELWNDCIGGLYQGFPDDEVARRGMIAWSPPWDITGWEMSEGFLKRWSWLLAGLPEAFEATNRWRMKRGEEPLVLDECTRNVIL